MYTLKKKASKLPNYKKDNGLSSSSSSKLQWIDSRQKEEEEGGEDDEEEEEVASRTYAASWVPYLGTCSFGIRF